MCYPVRCATCGKTGWGGCGEHVDSVMAGIPKDQRCTCGAVSDDDAHDVGRQSVPKVMPGARSPFG